VTCGGDFDDRNRSYKDNVNAFATLAAVVQRTKESVGWVTPTPASRPGTTPAPWTAETRRGLTWAAPVLHPHQLTALARPPST
jgi:hypothetical protein